MSAALDVLDVMDADIAFLRESGISCDALTAARAAVAELIAEQRQFREAFVVAVGDRSPFAKEALSRIDAALARVGGAK